MCFQHFYLQMCFAPQRRAIFDMKPPKVLRATAACHFWTSELPKLVRDCGVLCILTWKCASRHSGVPFFNIGTSKSAPTMRCFAHFDLTMWFSPQRRAIFQHRNVKKCSDHEVFCAFWPNNMVFATAAGHFSPVCWTATSAPAALASLLFEHQEPRIIEKTQRFATSLTFFAHVPSFEWRYTRGVDLLSADLTSLLCLTPLLCFSTLHMVGS